MPSIPKKPITTETHSLPPHGRGGGCNICTPSTPPPPPSPPSPPSCLGAAATIVTDGVRRRGATTGLSGGLCAVGKMGDVGSDSSPGARVLEALLLRRPAWGRECDSSSSSSSSCARAAPRRGGAGITVTGRLSVSGVGRIFSRSFSACVMAKSSSRPRRSQLVPSSCLPGLLGGAVGGGGTALSSSSSRGRRKGLVWVRARHRLPVLAGSEGGAGDRVGGIAGGAAGGAVGSGPELVLSSWLWRLDAALSLRDAGLFSVGGGGGVVRDVVSVRGWYLIA